jgi:hypothetical protein
MTYIPVSAIPQSEGRIVTNSDMADNADIRRAIIQAVPKAVEQTKELAKFYGRTSQRETCKAIFDFLKNEINYVADGYVQIVRLPSALLKTKVGDCKSYSVFTSAILTNLGIPHHFQMVSYGQDPTPSHIYVTTDDGCIIDAVWGKFDDEKRPTYRYRVKPNGKMMKVQTMTGISGGCSTAMGGGCGCGCNCPSCSGMGALFKRSPEKKAAAQERKDARQDKREDKKEARQDKREAKRDARDECGKQGAKPVTLSAGRTMFLLIVRNNLDGLATKLDKMDKAKVKTLWCNVGGNPYSLLEAIKIGASKKSKRLGFLGKLAKKVGIQGVGATSPAPTLQSRGFSTLPAPSQEAELKKAIVPVSLATSTAVGTMVGQPAKGAAAGTSFAAVTTALTPLILGAMKIMVAGDAGDSFTSQTDLDLTEDTTDFPPASAGAGAGAGTPPDDDSKGGNTMTYVLIGAAAIGAYFIFKK